MTKGILFVFVVHFGIPTLASAEMSWVRKAYDVEERVAEHFRTGEFNSEIALAMKELLKVAIVSLKEKGFINEARQLEERLKGPNPFTMDEAGSLGVGDHQPWRPEIDSIYSLLISTLGPQLVKELHLDDLHTFNYAAPVAVQPCGDKRNGEIWDKPEYEVHFVPFMTIIVYWASRLACQIEAGNYGLEALCKPATEQVRNATRELLAPPVGREIFDQSQPKCHR